MYILSKMEKVNFLKTKERRYSLTYIAVHKRTYTKQRFVQNIVAYSKSFLAVLAKMVKAILYPNSHSFVTSGGKEQASGILAEKVDELCELIPALKNEIYEGRGKGTTKSKDYTKILFKNGSYIDNVAARETSRGKRRTDGTIEEVENNCLYISLLLIRRVTIQWLTGKADRYTCMSKHVQAKLIPWENTNK